ncbi:MAG: amino acid ABC transporter ATP-binding protein [Proteobacteria bacterium]|nr:amino acid ABC transporter ATP-binding protein [Pseudomonadota bacterium]
MPPSMIELTELHKRYDGVHALRGISLGVAEGEVRVLIGPSGCGKSTLLRCINLLEQPTSGSVRVGEDEFRFEVGGRMPPARRLDRYRSNLGMVFQQFDLFPHMTALENVAAGPRIVKRLPLTQARELARSLLAKVGLSDKADVYPRNLSGGQAQRVAIARALAMEPRVILFDEATSALDPELVEEVLRVMRQLASEQKTMVIVTHEMAFARDVAHRVCFMDGGLVVEEGTADAVLRRPTNPRTRSFLSRYHLDQAGGGL